MATSLFMPFMQRNYNDDYSNDNEGIHLWGDTLKALEVILKKMTPSLAGEDCTYEKWQSVAKKGPYRFFALWLEKKGELYLSKICGMNLNEGMPERLLDCFDEAIFDLQMASEVDDEEVLAADVADVLTDLSMVIEQYEQHDENVIVYDEDIELSSSESSFECMNQNESSLDSCGDFFISVAA